MRRFRLTDFAAALLICASATFAYADDKEAATPPKDVTVPASPLNLTLEVQGEALESKDAPPPQLQVITGDGKMEFRLANPGGDGQKRVYVYSQSDGGGGAAIRIAGPVVVLQDSPKLLEGLTLNFTKNGQEPGQLVVTRGEEKWTVSESDIHTLPPEIQARVRSMFGQLAGPHPILMPRVGVPGPALHTRPLPPEIAAKHQAEHAARLEKMQAEHETMIARIKALHEVNRARVDDHRKAAELELQKVREAEQAARQAHDRARPTPPTPPVAAVPGQPSADIQELKKQQEAMHQEMRAIREALDALLKEKAEKKD